MAGTDEQLALSATRKVAGGRQAQIYLILAVVNLFGVAGTIWASRSMMSSYERSVREAEGAAQRVELLSDLSRLAGDANAPGNDVFENKNPDQEAVNMEAASQAFLARLQDAQQGVPRGLPVQDALEIQATFPKVEERFSAMRQETDKIFASFRAGDTDTAAAHMAAMDARFGDVRDLLDGVRKKVTTLQHHDLAASLETATSARHVSDLIGAFVVLMVLGVSAYGLRLARRFTDAQRRIAARNQDMRLVLDNAEQGFATVSLDGKVGDERSAIFDTWFGKPRAHERLWDWIGRRAPSSASSFEIGWGQLQEDWLPLELALDQLPQRVRAEGRVWEFKYRPIFTQGSLAQLLVVVSDATAEDARRRMEQGQRDMVNIVERMMNDRTGTLDFFEEAKVLLAQITAPGAEITPELRRAIHTLKGNAALFGLHGFAGTCHDLETKLNEDGNLSPALLADLSSQWGDILYRLAPLLGEASSRDLIELEGAEHRAVLSLLAQPVSKDLIRYRVESWKHESIHKRLARLAEHAEALAKRTGKAPLQIVCEDNGLRLPGEQWGPYWAALVHAVRNAIDHGMETPEERAAAGKDVPGTLTLRAAIRDREFVVEVEDNGRGIQWERLAEKAKSRGLPHATREDLVELLFLDGVSTREEVTDISGRGIGMGALRSVCHALRGKLEVSSQPGLGTCIRSRWDIALVEGLRWAAPPSLSALHKAVSPSALHKALSPSALHKAVSPSHPSLHKVS